jgi:hypothetical protein
MPCTFYLLHSSSRKLSAQLLYYPIGDSPGVLPKLGLSPASSYTMRASLYCNAEGMKANSNNKGELEADHPIIFIGHETADVETSHK